MEGLWMFVIGILVGLAMGPVGDVFAWASMRCAAKKNEMPMPKWNWRLLVSGIAYMMWAVDNHREDPFWTKEDDNASNG